MEFLTHLDHASLDDTCLAIGAFDGVHLGHQSIIFAMVNAAREKGYPSCVLTFEPHPSEILSDRPTIDYLMNPSEKAATLGDFGIEYVISHPFDQNFSRHSAASFLDLVQARLNFSSIWVGEDFGFGHDREGNTDYLQQETARREFELKVMPRIQLGEVPIKSSTIRRELADGHIKTANQMLGRMYSISTEAVQGGMLDGLPGTAKVQFAVPEKRALPGQGVYAGIATESEKQTPAIIEIGAHSTSEVGPEIASIEAYLLDFPDINDQSTFSLEFLDWLHNDLYFHDLQNRSSEIERDAAVVQRLAQAAAIDQTE